MPHPHASTAGRLHDGAYPAAYRRPGSGLGSPVRRAQPTRARSRRPTLGEVVLPRRRGCSAGAHSPSRHLSVIGGDASRVDGEPDLTGHDERAHSLPRSRDRRRRRGSRATPPQARAVALGRTQVSSARHAGGGRHPTDTPATSRRRTLDRRRQRVHRSARAGRQRHHRAAARTKKPALATGTHSKHPKNTRTKSVIPWIPPVRRSPSNVRRSSRSCSSFTEPRARSVVNRDLDHRRMSHVIDVRFTHSEPCQDAPPNPRHDLQREHRSVPSRRRGSRESSIE